MSCSARSSALCGMRRMSSDGEWVVARPAGQCTVIPRAIPAVASSQLYELAVVTQATNVSERPETVPVTCQQPGAGQRRPVGMK